MQDTTLYNFVNGGMNTMNNKLKKIVGNAIKYTIQREVETSRNKCCVFAYYQPKVPSSVLNKTHKSINKDIK